MWEGRASRAVRRIVVYAVVPAIIGELVIIAHSLFGLRHSSTSSDKL
jgi:hypothetical protein